MSVLLTLSCRVSDSPLVEPSVDVSVMSRDEEIAELVNEILQGQGPIIIEEADPHFEELKGFLFLLLRTENGWSLVQEMKSCENSITIASEVSDSQIDKSRYCFAERKAYLEITPRCFQLVKNPDDTISIERQGSTRERVASLGHELFHGLLDLRGQGACSEPPAGDPEFDSLEEEVVIETGEFAENKTRAELGLGARINHRSYSNVLRAIVHGVEKGIPVSELLYGSGVVWRKEELKETLMRAAFVDRRVEVRHLLEAASTPWTAKDLREILMGVAWFGKYEMLEQLLEAAASPWKAKDLREALRTAAFSGHRRIIWRLLRASSEPWTAEDLKLPLFGASFNGHLKVVRMFLQAAPVQWNGADLNMALEKSAKRDEWELMDLLLEAASGTWAGRDLKNSIHIVIRKRNLVKMKQILRAGQGSWEVEDLLGIFNMARDYGLLGRGPESWDS